jgi:hypothetical protein
MTGNDPQWLKSCENRALHSIIPLVSLFFLGDIAASGGNFLQTFRDKILVQFSWSKKRWYLNDGLLRNVGKKLPTLAA